MSPTNLPTSPVTDAASREPKPNLNLDPAEQRRRDPDFLARGAITSLANRLPLPWPTPPETPPSPKRRYRSAYQPPDSRRLLDLDEGAWAALGNFDLVLDLVDFSGLRPVLAEKLYQASALGRVPYDPISFFLLFGWQLFNRWKRLEVLRHLKEPRHSDYATAFGFRPGSYPSESGYRYFLTTLGKKPLSDLLVQSMHLVQRAGLIPEAVQQAAIVSFDGQIHDAASRLRCHDVRDSCYQPTSDESPRACPARQQGKPGCACDSLACRQFCKLATPRDQEARYVWYAGHNRHEPPNAESTRTSADGPPADNSPDSKSDTSEHSSTHCLQGEGRYGYRSLPGQLIDPTWRDNWTLDEAELAPANTREETSAGKLLGQIVGEYDWLHVGSAVGDAGLGYEPFLSVAYELGVRRVVDLRADPRSDHDKDAWGIRGYDDKGWAVCQFGHRLHPNGYDSERRRMKWCCRQACEQPADSPGLPIACPPDCPYRDRAEHPFGRIVNVGETFADGSLRLVRDVPYGSIAWKELYRRGRNAAEGRNARLEEWGLKRLPIFGQARAKATIFLADLWGNLLQLARLIKEATLAKLTQITQASQST
jgi:hypothetical protein